MTFPEAESRSRRRYCPASAYSQTLRSFPSGEGVGLKYFLPFVRVCALDGSAKLMNLMSELCLRSHLASLRISLHHSFPPSRSAFSVLTPPPANELRRSSLPSGLIQTRDPPLSRLDFLE